MQWRTKQWLDPPDQDCESKRERASPLTSTPVVLDELESRGPPVADVGASSAGSGGALAKEPEVVDRGDLKMQQDAVDFVPMTPAARRPTQSTATTLAGRRNYSSHSPPAAMPNCSRSPPAPPPPRKKKRDSITASTRYRLEERALAPQ